MNQISLINSDECYQNAIRRCQIFLLICIKFNYSSDSALNTTGEFTVETLKPSGIKSGLSSTTFGKITALVIPDT